MTNTVFTYSPGEEVILKNENIRAYICGVTLYQGGTIEYGIKFWYGGVLRDERIPPEFISHLADEFDK